MIVVVMTTIADEAAAERLADALVERKLAACVQILPPMKSVYVWEGKVQRETEHLLLIKTLATKYDDVERFIQENHPYDTPEVVAIAAETFSKAYFEWVKESVAGV